VDTPPHDLLRLATCFGLGAVAAGITAVAGGGTLLSFPVLVALGWPAVIANATNAASLWPGSLGSALGFRDERSRATIRRHLPLLLVPTFLGSALGALLLTASGERLFRLLVPGLVLLSTVLLWLQPRLRRHRQAAATLGAAPRRLPTWAVLLLQLFIGVYGGYFGAGMGILMLALLGLYIEGDLHEHNALKAWLGVAVNLLASVIFFWQGLIDLPAGAAMALGAVLGGYAAARLSLRVKADALRLVIVVIGALLSLWFTLRALRG
jgi:hypothetical protein